VPAAAGPQRIERKFSQSLSAEPAKSLAVADGVAALAVGLHSVCSEAPLCPLAERTAVAGVAEKPDPRDTELLAPVNRRVNNAGYQQNMRAKLPLFFLPEIRK